MRLLIDIGNTDTKWLLAGDGWQLSSEKGILGKDGWGSVVDGLSITEAMLCASGGDPDYHCDELAKWGVRVMSFDARQPLPIRIDYTTPETLGQDRVAAACGAWQLCQSACLIIDAGTCTTVDYLDRDGVFRGGAILPGAEMQLLSLYQNTARLPHVELDYNEPTNPLGTSTKEAMKSGVVCGARYALRGMVDHYRHLDAGLHVLYTGGVGEYLCREIDGAQYCPDLLFLGLSAIAQHLRH